MNFEVILPPDIARHRNNLKCVCGHFESVHGFGGSVHNCPDCECQSAISCRTCIANGGDCEEFSPVKLAGGALTPEGEWAAYFAAFGVADALAAGVDR